MKKTALTLATIMLMSSTSLFAQSDSEELDLYSAAVIKLIKKYKSLDHKVKETDHTIFLMQYNLQPIKKFKYQGYNPDHSKLISDFIAKK